MISLLILAVLAVSAFGEPCTRESNAELLLSLNKDLLRAADSVSGTPNPSVHLALRLSDHHSLSRESANLQRLTGLLHTQLQSALSQSPVSPGPLALYLLALKSSCFDLNSVSFTVRGHSDSLINHLKSSMQREKEEITVSQQHRPSSSYYQYALGVLGLCVGGVRVEHHVLHKLLKAVEHEHLEQGAGCSTDTYAMAGMALQCVRDFGAHALNTQELNTALTKIKNKLTAARRTDGHIGNTYSTGLAVQALLALGHPEAECAASMEAMRTDARNNLYRNPMALSQVLPALQQRSYLTLRTKQCLGEDDSLVLEPPQPEVQTPPSPPVLLSLSVVNLEGVERSYSLEVPHGSSLLQALELLASGATGFTFRKESSLWGPFLSEVNGEQARQSDRRYWHLSAEGAALTQGIKDYKIETPQKIVLKNTSY